MLKNLQLLRLICRRFVPLFAQLCALCSPDFYEHGSLIEKDNSVFSLDHINVVIEDNFDEYKKMTENDLDVFFQEIEHGKIETLFELDKSNPSLSSFFAGKKVSTIYSLEVKDKTISGIVDAVEKTQRINGVKIACPDYVLKSQSVIDYSPSDEFYDGSWWLHGENGIDVPPVWYSTSGSPEVRVGIIDSGVQHHIDLQDNIDFGYDFFNNNQSYYDDERGHGTNIAGIVSGQCNGLGIVGVSPNSKIVPLQIEVTNGVHDESETYNSLIIRAIHYAANNWGTRYHIPILNLSYEGYGTNGDILSAVSSYPGLFVWAAGNQSRRIDSFSGGLDFGLDNLISVGAINSDGSKHSSSNYGTKVDIFAPGNGIRCAKNYDEYIIASGTSMAAGFVSGVAALLLSYNRGLSSSQLKECILNGASYCSISGNVGEQYSSSKLSASGAIVYASSNFAPSPEPLRLSVVCFENNAWMICVDNGNDQDYCIQYKTKTCQYNEAYAFSLSSDINEENIASNSYRIVNVEQTPGNQYISFSIGYSINSMNYRVITYTNGLIQSGAMYSCNPTRSHTISFGNNFQNISLIPNYLSFTVHGKVSGKWKIRIHNPNSFGLSVIYNKKMCFEQDAKTYAGCNDTASVFVSAGQYQEVSISENFLARFITSKIEYRYRGFAFRAVTYANALSTSSSNCAMRNHFERVT
ncbi:MAG: S8 family serine peptidase [Bacilli bacterium]|nr:S8 family serine peptidase [Bacilli bacterium]